MSSQYLRVSRRYAKALLDLAVEHQILERAYEDMKLIHASFRSSQELKILMKSPIVREGKKQRILIQLFEDRVHPLILGYLKVIVRKQRAVLLESISGAFLMVYKETLGIEAVKLTTAKPLDSALREKALLVAKGLTEKSIEFNEVVDPRIIGGFILNLGERQYDASVRSKLSRLRRHLNIP